MNGHNPPTPKVAVELTGAPERVWEMVATGSGISPWFLPASVGWDWRDHRTQTIKQPNSAQSWKRPCWPRPARCSGKEGV